MPERCCLPLTSGTTLERATIVEPMSIAVYTVGLGGDIAPDSAVAILGSGPIGAPDPERVNVNGGAIALGHPVGASGGRLVLTLLLEMARRDVALGLATLCVGGGQGAAVLLENPEGSHD